MHNFLCFIATLFSLSILSAFIFAWTYLDLIVTLEFTSLAEVTKQLNPGDVLILVVIENPV
jgi:hypothetical protein